MTINEQAARLKKQSGRWEEEKLRSKSNQPRRPRQAHHMGLERGVESAQGQIS